MKIMFSDNTSIFIKKAIKIHGDEYDYSLVEYVNSSIKIKIICHKHGIFEQTPNSHLRGRGCPHCKLSNGEKNVRKYLISNNIKYEEQKTFPDCKDKSLLRFDFYLSDKNILIEYDGIQHFGVYREEIFNYNYIKKHDDIKNEYAKKNDIKLIRIPYNDSIENILNKNLMRV